jgi:hypothetical protein
MRRGSSSTGLLGPRALRRTPDAQGTLKRSRTASVAALSSRRVRASDNTIALRSGRPTRRADQSARFTLFDAASVMD